MVWISEFQICRVMTVLTVAAMCIGHQESAAGADAAENAAVELEIGPHVFDAAEHGWTGITRVWYYRPDTNREALRAVMVIHGAGRNGDDYRDAWIPLAKDHGLLIIAPEFGDRQYLQLGGGVAWRFHTGNLVSRSGEPVPEEDWYFESVEQLFRAVRRGNDAVEDRYVLFGHSAGGQFVHRMVLFKPDAQFGLAIAANSGWYTYPDKEQPYPYGIAGSPYTPERLGRALGRPMVVFLGTEDTPEQGGFRTQPRAMNQGTTRQERGKGFYDFGKSVAERLDAKFRWRLEYADGVGHSYVDMAEASETLLREYNLLPGNSESLESGR